MGGRYLLEGTAQVPAGDGGGGGRGGGGAQEFPGDGVSVPLQTWTASLNMEAIRTAPPKSKKQKVPRLFSVFNERKSVCCFFL